MGMGDNCPTPGCGQLGGHPGACRVNDLDRERAKHADLSSWRGTRTELTMDDVADAQRRLVEDSARPRWTCPTRNCRRTDPHDAKGCVVAWTEDALRGVKVRGPLPRDVDGVYFTNPRLKP